jgi:copper chaperone NosL
MNVLIKAAIVVGLSVLAGCGKEEAAVVPPPVATALDATGRYCGMLLAEHAGPKGQILLKSGSDPVWFTSVRDTFTFLALPEEPKDVAAVYVSDMGKAPSWEKPGDQNWILAGKAVYVVESDQAGGMGGAEAVPFGEESAAQTFVGQHGGRIVPFDDAKKAMAKEGSQQ